MEKTNLVYRTCKFTEYLCVPLWFHIKYLIFAYQIKIILILSYNKKIYMKHFYEFIKEMIFTELCTVYEHNPGIKIFFTLYSKYFFHIIPKYIILCNNPVRADSCI